MIKLSVDRYCDIGGGEIHTLRDAFRKYANEMTKGKSNPRWEQLRVANLESQNLPMDLPICQINTNHISIFRDHRLKSVSNGTVLRDLSLLSSIFEAARIDWCWILNNPVKDIRKPPSPKHRDRVLTIWEIKAMLRSLKYNHKKRPQAAIHSIAHCLLLALRTGMRAGELCSLSWDNVHENYAYLPMTKNGKPRVVPLSIKAKKIIEKMRDWDSELVFGLKKQTLDTMFRRYRDYAGLSGFTWHDTRHTGLKEL